MEARRRSARRIAADGVTGRDWKHHAIYDQFATVHESVIRHTSTAEAPWILVEGYDWRYRNLTVAKVVLEGLRNGEPVA